MPSPVTAWMRSSGRKLWELWGRTTLADGRTSPSRWRYQNDGTMGSNRSSHGACQPVGCMVGYSNRGVGPPLQISTFRLWEFHETAHCWLRKVVRLLVTRAEFRPPLISEIRRARDRHLRHQSWVESWLLVMQSLKDHHTGGVQRNH